MGKAGQKEKVSDSFGQAELERFMKTVWTGHPAHFYPSLDSTNIRAKLEAQNGAPQGTLIVADRQTAGRGRRGRVWESPAGVNVYCSLLLKPDYAPEQASMTTLVMALAVVDGIEQTCGLQTRIKWPNDIVVGGKKVCGILTEMELEKTSVRHIVIGIGINVGRQKFPSQLTTATTLEAECGKKVSRASLIANTMRAFEGYYADFEANGDLSGLLERYNKLSANCGQKVRVLDPQGEFQGVALGINRKGELQVRCGNGSVVAVYAGEVSVRGIYGYT